MKNLVNVQKRLFKMIYIECFIFDFFHNRDL